MTQIEDKFGLIIPFVGGLVKRNDSQADRKKVSTGALCKKYSRAGGDSQVNPEKVLGGIHKVRTPYFWPF